MFVSEKTRNHFVDLVSNAYSSISLSDFAKLVGLTELEAGDLASRQKGWTIDAANKMIIPVRKELPETEAVPSEHQLELLTNFVAHLEK